MFCLYMYIQSIYDFPSLCDYEFDLAVYIILINKCTLKCEINVEFHWN